MADKLNESTWTGFLKKLKLELEDKPLVKALAAFDKTDASKPEPHLKALEEVVKQIPEQVKALVKRKKELGDKVFGEVKDKLYELLAVAEKLEKEVRVAKEKAERDEAAGAEEEESPALLTSKMIPLLRAVRKGDVVLQALIAVAGKETVVLVSRKPISPALGKLLKEQMVNPGGLKFIRGECLMENGALTFVVAAGASGLAKKIKLALLSQTDLRMPVRVRGEDPADVDEEAEDAGEGPHAGSAPVAGQAPANPVDGASVGGPADVDPGTAFKARFAALLPAVKAAQADGHPSAQDIKLQASQAGVLANKREFEAANDLLDVVERMLLQRGTTPAQGGGARAGTDVSAAFTARLKDFMPKLAASLATDPARAGEAKLKASEAGVFARKGDFGQAMALLAQAETLLGGGGASGATTGGATGTGTGAAAAKPLSVWIDAKDLVGEQISQLQAKLRGVDHPAFAQIADKGLNGITQRLQVGLQASLTDYDRAPDAVSKDKARAAARTRLAEFRAFVTGDATVRLIDENPMGVQVSLRSTLGGAFDSIERALAA